MTSRAEKCLEAVDRFNLTDEEKIEMAAEILNEVENGLRRKYAELFINNLSENNQAELAAHFADLDL